MQHDSDEHSAIASPERDDSDHGREDLDSALGKISWELPIDKVEGQTCLTLGFGHHSPRCWPKLFGFWHWTGGREDAADHGAVVVLAQVAFRIKVPHAGLGAAAHPPLQEIRTHLDARLRRNAEKLAKLARLVQCSRWRTMSPEWALKEPDDPNAWLLSVSTTARNNLGTEQDRHPLVRHHDRLVLRPPRRYTPFLFPDSNIQV